MSGTMTERKPGVWLLRVVSHYDPKTGNPRQVSRTFKGSKRGAASALAAFSTQIAQGFSTATAETTLEDFFERWLEFAASHRESSTLVDYRAKVRRINAKLGSVKLSKLTPQMIDRCYSEWMTEMANSSVHHLHRVLAAALHQAVKWDILPRSPTDRATPPSAKTKTRAPATMADIRFLIKEAEERSLPVLATAIVLAATTGLRCGELCGLCWSDVDFAHRDLVVQRSVHVAPKEQGTWKIGDTKTHRSRTLRLDPLTLEILHRHRERMHAASASANVVLKTDGYILSFSPDGTEFWRPSSMAQQLKRLCVSAGIANVGFHQMRHSVATQLIGAGVDVRTVAGRLGHADATTTLRVYAHLLVERDDAAAGIMGELLAAAPDHLRWVPPVGLDALGQDA